MSRNECFFSFEYHMFYVSYPFMNYLLTLPLTLFIFLFQSLFQYLRLFGGANSQRVREGPWGTTFSVILITPVCSGNDFSAIICSNLSASSHPHNTQFNGSPLADLRGERNIHDVHMKLLHYAANKGMHGDSPC
jgi:hypothetical protein